LLHCFDVFLKPLFSPAYIKNTEILYNAGGVEMNIKGTVTRIFAEKDSGFKIVAVSILDLRTIPLNKRNPDYPDSISAVGVLKGVERDYVVELSVGKSSQRRLLAVAVEGFGLQHLRA
jgi:hypothetical protein